MEHSPLSRHHLNYVSQHFNQTRLVELLCTIPEGLCYEDIEGFELEREIYQWLVFPRFDGIDLERLIATNIPVIDSDYGCWIGITSFGSHYDLYVYPELIEALFGVKCDHEDIHKLRFPRFTE